MDEFVCCRIKGISSNSHVHGNEAPTKYPNLLGKNRFYIPLSNNFKYYVSLSIHAIAAVPPYYKSRNL
jgi:hypothetical protein